MENCLTLTLYTNKNLIQTVTEKVVKFLTLFLKLQQLFQLTDNFHQKN